LRERTVLGSIGAGVAAGAIGTWPSQAATCCRTGPAGRESRTVAKLAAPLFASGFMLRFYASGGICEQQFGQIGT
jgi:hypothetical protein